ncbi:FxDxF family PEP-CTERM protein [Sphingomonas sp. MA1305]|uniref:FxDxF family PEP-CTERM protein n=1 Tax=Sphingomonas sp. MA1305 TaxID=2479204 RepID=UPI0018DF2FE9|nr:FxDxF family PEP-CTERM protein [Sphingomonas sp. MA1305]
MKKLLMVGAAIATLTAAQNASAASTVARCDSGNACTIAFDGTASMAAGTFGNASVTNPSFVDRYTFDLGTGLFSLTLTTLFTGNVGSAGDIDFSLVRLNPPVGGNVIVPVIAGTDEIYRLQNLAVTAGQYVLRLEGTGASNVNASYSGTLNFSAAAVPEPATWAMMILGMGAIGFAMRRSRKSKVSTTVRFA